MFHHVEKRASGALGRRKSGETGAWEEPTPKKYGDMQRIDQFTVDVTARDFVQRME